MSLLIFPFFYLKEIILGTALVTRDALNGCKYVSPKILKLDTSSLSQGQRYTLACLVSMTPGTLSIGESDDGTSMDIHCLYAQERASVLQGLEDNYLKTIAKLPI